MLDRLTAGVSSGLWVKPIVAVLNETDGEIRLRDIHVAVEQRLGGSVSLCSVADFLLRRSKGRKPLFVHTGYGHYRLRGRQGSDARDVRLGEE
jgi:hypothetical protein